MEEQSPTTSTNPDLPTSTVMLIAGKKAMKPGIIEPLSGPVQALRKEKDLDASRLIIPKPPPVNAIHETELESLLPQTSNVSTPPKISDIKVDSQPEDISTVADAQAGGDLSETIPATTALSSNT